MARGETTSLPQYYGKPIVCNLFSKQKKQWQLNVWFERLTDKEVFSILHTQKINDRTAACQYFAKLSEQEKFALYNHWQPQFDKARAKRQKLIDRRFAEKRRKYNNLENYKPNENS